jgi:translation initiation factor 2B subunit (eIF-2B alpha/beta/delta family)
MKSIMQIFRTNPSLVDEPEVEKLIEYCRELEDELVNMRLSDTKVMEDKLAELVRDIYKSVNMTIQDQKDAIRFGEAELVDFEESVNNLKAYISEFARDNKFRL